MRAARWAWPLLFLLPLGWWAGRFCWLGPIDLAYHTTLALHEWLPALLALAVSASVAAVAIGLSRIRGRAASLLEVATTPPLELDTALADEARRAHMIAPKVAYLEVAAPLCFMLAGTRATMVISRGFLEGLEPKEIGFVIRHELAHVRRRDPTRGILWHLFFAALLFPGFEPLERWLSRRRELRANLAAGRDSPEEYASLLERRASQRQMLCADGPPPKRHSLFALFGAPVLAATILTALAVSHLDVIHNLRYLTTHHC